jgi:hypothetical protein
VCLAGVVTLLLAWRARNLDAATAVPGMPAKGQSAMQAPGEGPAASAESPAIPLRQG